MAKVYRSPNSLEMTEGIEEEEEVVTATGGSSEDEEESTVVVVATGLEMAIRACKEPKSNPTGITRDVVDDADSDAILESPPPPPPSL